MFNSRFQALLATALSALVLALPAGSGNSRAGELHRANKKQDAQPVIWIGDFNNFDDAVALMLVAKDPRYRLELIVVEESFNTVAHGANTVFNILEWLGNLDNEVIRGAYHARDEVTLGANGVDAKGTRVDDANSVPGQPDYQLPGSAANERFNLERRNVVGINIYGQFAPGPWRDNGATLYSTDHLIPRATQDQYHYQGNRGTAFDFKPAEDIILERLSQVDRKAVILSTGKLTTLARMLAKGSEAELDKIRQVVMMGGGFQGLEPFTAGHPAACFGDKSLNLGGNIFSHPSFNCDTDFSTHQEFNILLDPASAEQAFDLLSEKRIKATLIPTNATDNAKIQLASIGALASPGGTPESCYTSKLFAAIRAFEGGDFNGTGDFALDAVIRLWDIVAALVVLDPQLITETKNAYVDVDQLNPGLAASATPYDPITFDPTVGKTTLSKDGTGRQFRIVISVDTDAARQAMINRLRDGFNAAVQGDRCGDAG